MAIGIFLTAMDQTIIVSCKWSKRLNVDLDGYQLTAVSSAYASIGSELNQLQNTSWIATSYLLTITSFQ